MAKIEGSCLCGAIKYKSSVEPLYSIVCHCFACQKSTGSVFSPIFGINKSDLLLTGDCLKKYGCIADSGNTIDRYFCSNCGSLIYGVATSNSNVLLITAGTLNNSSWFKPQINTFWNHHVSWLPEINNIPKYDTMPGRE